MARAWKWIAAAGAVCGLIVLYLFWRSRGRTVEASRTMADVIDAWTEPKLAAQRAEVERLKTKIGKSHVVIDMAQSDVDKTKEELRSKYQALALTPEEIETRFARLRV